MIALTARIRPQRLFGSLEKVAAEGGGGGGPLQAKTAWPSHDEQVIAPDEDYYGLVSVKVMPVPKLPAAVVSFDVGFDIGNFVGEEISLSVGGELVEENPSKCYYNGEIFPEMPTGFDEWTHRVILYNTEDGQYYAGFSKSPWFKNGDYYSTNTSSPLLLYLRGSNLYWLYTSTVNRFKVSRDNLVWSSHDVPDGSATAEEIYFAGSEPVPA